MAGILETQNKAWAEDKSKFGYKMLQKMGWSEGKGLGLKEDGTTSHIRVRKKTTNSGVGLSASAHETWKVPAKVANDLNDVLSRLSHSVSGEMKQKQPGQAPANEGSVQNATRSSRGYFGRRAAGKLVGTYSAAALKEIFGGAPCLEPRGNAFLSVSGEEVPEKLGISPQEALPNISKERKKKKEKKKGKTDSKKDKKQKERNSLSRRDAGITKDSKKTKRRKLGAKLERHEASGAGEAQKTDKRRKQK